MTLNKNLKTGLIIGSIALGTFLILGAVYYVINLNKGGLVGEFYTEDYQGAIEPSYDESYSFSDSKEERTMELDALNYDEANTESKIRKVGTVNLTVDDLDTANDEVLDVLSDYNGTVLSSSQRGTGNNKSVTITLKVPVEYFEDLYETIRDIDGEVDYASYYTDDVTQEYIDLESRLKNLESTETQLVKILNTAETVEDTLAVYTQLTSTRSQIEVIKGQLKYLDNQVDYSYLTVNLSLSDVGKDVKDEKWQPFGVFKNAIASLVDFGIFVVDALIWVLVFSPVVLIPILIIKAIVKKKAKNKEKVV